MSTETLYSWARHLDDVPFLDHTWVTDFTEPATPAPGDNYWYCWGELHTTLDKDLATGQADLAVASAIMPPNTPAKPEGTPAYQKTEYMGAIDYYGLDGVCHQTANEVLAATGSSGEAVTVMGAAGYGLSTFMFGTYGLNDEKWGGIVAAHLTGYQLAGDQFETLLNAAVTDSASRAKVLEYRAIAQLAMAALRTQVVAGAIDNYYPAVGVIAAGALYKVKSVLTDAEFDALFPSIDFDNEMWLQPPMD